MKSYFSKIAVFLALILPTSQGFGQHWLGMANSNLGGTNAAYTNPASLGGNEYKMYINAFGVGFNVNNDYVSWGAPFSLNQLVRGKVDDQYKDSTGRVNFQSSYLKQKLNGKNKNLYIESEVRGPAVMYRLGTKSAIAFSSRSRIGLNLTNVSENLAKLLVNGIDTNGVSTSSNITVGSNLDNLRLRMSALAFNEYALSFGHQFLEIKSLKIKFGATAKFLVGNAYGYAQGDNIDFKISGIDSIRVNEASFRYGYSDFDKFKEFSPRSLIPSLNGDYGFGWDAGAIVEYNPKVTQQVTGKKSNYLFKFGLSIIDRGSIRFKNNATNYTVSSKGPFTYVADSTAKKAFENGAASEEATAYVDSIVDAHFNISKANAINYKLPSMLSIQFDYHIFKSFYVGAIIYQDIRSINIDKVSLHRPSQITLLPRFESRLVEVSIPIILGSDYKIFQAGGFIRVGPVFAGSDNLKALLTQENFYGVNTYFGIAKGIGHDGAKKKKKEQAKAQAFAKNNISVF